MINHTFPFAYFSGYDLLYLVDNVDEEYEYFSNSKSSASGCCLAFAQRFCQSTLALLIIQKNYLNF